MRMYCTIIACMLAGIVFSQTGMTGTRQNYLQKMSPLEYQLFSIENKWNWIVTDPVEDSIAIAEGWYEKTAARREQVKYDMITVKIEQLQNYCTDVAGIAAAQTAAPTAWEEMVENRARLAPNYPSHDERTPYAESAVVALRAWIMAFPQEYENLTTYLEELVLTHAE